MTRPNLEQGEGGAGRQKSTSHNPREQGEGGAAKKGPSITQKGGKIPANLDGQNSSSGSDHLTPHRALTNRPSPVRGGGTVVGHDRVNPNAGKAYSGKKFSEKSDAERVGHELHRDRGKKQPLDGATYLTTKK